MFTLVVTEKGGSPKRMEFEKDEITIGRVPGNDVILPKGNVSKRHSRVVRQDGRFFVVDLKSTNGTYLNGRRITTPSVIRPGDKIYVGDFVVMVEMGEAPPASEAEPMEAAEELEPESPLGDVESDDEIDAPAPRPESPSVEPLRLDQEPPESAPPPAMPSRNTAPLGAPPGPAPLGGGPRPGMLTQPLGSAASAAVGSPPGASAARPTQPPPARPTPAGPIGVGRTTASVPQMAAVPPGRMPLSPSSAAPAARPTGPLGGPPPSLGPAPGSLGAAPGPIGPPGPLGAPPILGGGPATRPVASASSALGPAPFGGESAPRRSPSGPVIPPLGRAPSSASSDADDDDLVRTGIAAQTPLPSSAASTPTTPPPASLPPPAAAPVIPAAAPVPVAHATPPEAMAPPATRGRASGAATTTGREYATLLGSVVNDARHAGAPSQGDRPADAATRARVRQAVDAVVRGREGLPHGVTADQLAHDAAAEIAGTGAFESALEEPDVTSIVVEPSGRVLLGRGAGLSPSAYWFSDDAAVILSVERLLHGAGIARRNDALIDVALPGGLRLLAVLPPATTSGPTVVLERPATRAASLNDLVTRGVLTAQAVGLLGHALAARRNVIISGPRGAGRSTFLTALVAAVAPQDRCVVVEAHREVGVGVPEVTSIEARDDWKRAVEIGVRLRPQRLVLGDGNEATAAAFVASLATGAEGALLVVEGASPSAALQRLATLAATGGGASSREEALARLAITRPCVVHLARLGDGSCRVVSIGEARGADGGGVHVDESFALRIDGTSDGRVDATLAATGLVPSFAGGQ